MIIKIPNTAFITDGEKKLSPDENILFAHLFKHRNPDYQLLFSVDLISQVLKFKKGNDRENKSCIRKLLLALKDKGYIDCGINVKTNYETAVIGTVINQEKDYSGVESSILDEMLTDDLNKSKLKFYIYSDVNRFAVTGYRTSFYTISSKLNYFDSIKNHSVGLVVELINEMDGKYIFRFSGERKEGTPEQEANLYYSFQHITSELKQNHVKHVYAKKEKKKRIRKDHELLKPNPYGYDTVGDLKEVIKDEVNWFKCDFGYYNQLFFSDFYIYRLAKDENVATKSFVKRVDAAIESIQDNPECPYDFDAWEQEYLSDMEISRQESEAEERQI